MATRCTTAAAKMIVVPGSSGMTVPTMPMTKRTIVSDHQRACMFKNGELTYWDDACLDGGSRRMPTHSRVHKLCAQNPITNHPTLITPMPLSVGSKAPDFTLNSKG